MGPMASQDKILSPATYKDVVVMLYTHILEGLGLDFVLDTRYSK